MSDIPLRIIKMNDWIFEIKSIRAIKVDNYGEPYSAIANLNFYGDTAHIDGFMCRDDEGLSEKDYQVFYRICQKLNITTAEINRFKEGKLIQESINLNTLPAKSPTLKLAL